MKRIKLADRDLPRYSRGEEIMNMVTHIVGGGIAILGTVACLIRSDSAIDRLGALVYCISMIALYTVSSIYHGLRPVSAKKVMQVIDHCTIYFLISGTYTPILLTGFVPDYPGIGWVLLAAQWGLCAVAVTLTAIDLKAYNVFSMICYIAMGWSIIIFLPQCLQVMTAPGFTLLLSGGIAYTVGAVLYGMGVKLRWMHSVFHIFVVLGSLLQLLSILIYVL